MILKTMQWNIGGGKLLLEGADPTLLKSYTQDGLDEIIEVIRAQDPYKKHTAVRITRKPSGLPKP
jgi:hypothetical protein